MDINKFNLNNKYKIKLSFDYYSVPNDILNYYYLPLIGVNALSIYLFLLTEAKNFYTNELYLKNERLVTMLNLSPEQIISAITKLELMGLVEIFIEPTIKNKLIYVLNEPLLPTNFINNEKISTLLKEKIGEGNFSQNRQYFNNTKFKEKDSLVSVTEKFQLEADHPNHQSYDLQTEYDFAPLFQILDSKNINYETNWSTEFEDIIKSAILFYDLSTIDLASIFEKINSKHQITSLSFKKYINDNKSRKIRNLEQLLDKKQNFLKAKKEMLDSKSPGEFFEIIIGREMLPKEQEFFKNLISNHTYNSGMINRLIDYCNLANNGIINLNFLKKISKTTIKHKIDSVEKLEKHLKTANMLSERNTKSFSPEIEKESSKDDLLNFEEIDFKL